MDFVRLLLQVLLVLSGVLTIILVLLHSPKGDGAGMVGSIGGMFSSQKGAEASLNKTTSWLVGIFMTTAFILGYYL